MNLKCCMKTGISLVNPSTSCENDISSFITIHYNGTISIKGKVLLATIQYRRLAHALSLMKYTGHVLVPVLGVLVQAG